VPDHKVAVVEHLFGLLNCFLIGITNNRLRTCDLVADRHFVNSVTGGRRHAQKYKIARREVECQTTMYSIVPWEMLVQLETLTTSSKHQLIFSASQRESTRRFERA
jgi:hypothetical protein